jgi:glycosyltransferase involved in cell wall biosynthesis
MIRKVLVVHPEQQHSNQMAAALASVGLLGKYICGAPQNPKMRDQIGPEKIKRLLLWLPLRRAATYMLPRSVRLEAIHRLARYFDPIIARNILSIRPDAVVAYENCALKVFEAAKRLGIPCILDVPSVHHQMQARAGVSVLRPAFQREVNLRKDREIALADLILVCSSLARDSFIEAGVDGRRIAVLPLGVDLERFYPANHSMPSANCIAKFVFVGHISAQKGADVLLRACQRLRQEGLPFELTLVGSNAPQPDLVEQFKPFGRILGQIPHEKLADVYRSNNCLVLPSRFDSFGLVVAEAMACGLAAIVSNDVGARDLIQNGRNGWVISTNDSDALFRIMAECARNPEKLHAMGRAARKAAEEIGWPVYRAHAAAIVCDFLSTYREKVANTFSSEGAYVV